LLGNFIHSDGTGFTMNTPKMMSLMRLATSSKQMERDKLNTRKISLRIWNWRRQSNLFRFCSLSAFHPHNRIERMVTEGTLESSKRKRLVPVQFLIKILKELKWTFNHSTSRHLRHSIASQNEKVVAVESEGGLDVLKTMDRTHKTFIFVTFYTLCKRISDLMEGHLSCYKQENNNI
jgi:hypothetical protein